MNVTVNGTRRTVSDDATVENLVRAVGRDPERAGTAIARNGDVVPRREWSTTRLDEGDDIEVVTAVGGG